MKRAGLVVLVLTLAACGGSSEAQAPERPAADRARAPAIAGETLDGKRVSLADLRGKPVFVNVWSSY